MALPKGILMDLDDTILAFDAVARPIWEHLCERYALRTSKCTAQSLFDCILRIRRWYWSDPTRHRRGRHDLDNARREIVRLAFRDLGIDDDDLADEMAHTYSEERDAAICFFPGAEATLQALVDNGVSLALITNGGAEQQWRKIKRFRLERFFASILVEGELGYGKPDRQVYTRALDELGLSTADVWAIGDNLEWEVAVPQSLGIYSIWHDYRRRGLPPDSPIVPDRIVNSISELIESRSQ